MASNKGEKSWINTFAHFADTNMTQLLATQIMALLLEQHSKTCQKTGLAHFAALQNLTSKKLPNLQFNEFKSHLRMAFLFGCLKPNESCSFYAICCLLLSSGSCLKPAASFRLLFLSLSSNKKDSLLMSESLIQCLWLKFRYSLILFLKQQRSDHISRLRVPIECSSSSVGRHGQVHG